MKEILVLIFIGSVLVAANNGPSNEECKESIENCVDGRIVDPQATGTKRCGCYKCDKEHYLVIKDYPFPKKDNIIPDVSLWGARCVKFCNNSKDSEVNL